ncbi:hypothetical protein Tco_0152812 [Tanacetum coccineum]
MPHDSPLPRVVALETDLTQTKKVYGADFTKLTKKVKRLEKKDKLNKSRRKLRLVLSDKEDEGITLVHMGVSTASIDFTTANVPVTTAGVEISTAGPEVKTTGDSVDDIAAKSLVYIRRIAAKTKDKGKGIMEESESAITKTKRQQDQERLGYKAALRLQEQLDEEESYTLQQLRGYSFDEIKSLFEATMKRVNNFTLMESDVDRTVPKIAVGSTKRAAEEELGQQSSKKQKSDELSQEELQQLMIIVPEEWMNIEALQTKYPIIDWEVYTKDSRIFKDQEDKVFGSILFIKQDLEEEHVPTGDQSGPSAPPAPKTAKQLTARRNQEKVKSILLLAIPDEYLLKFHNVADAKSLWEAIKSRVYEDELKRSSGSNSASKNLTFLSFENTSSTNEVSIASGDLALVLLEELIKFHLLHVLKIRTLVNYALMAISSSSSSSSSDSEKVVKERDELKDKIAKWEESSKNLDEILNSQMSARDKTGLGYGTQLNELSSNHETDSENSLSIFYVRSSDEENTPENDRFLKNGYKVVPPPITGNFLTPRADISFAGLDEYAIRNKIIESQTTELNTKKSETAGQTNDANTEKPKSAVRVLTRTSLHRPMVSTARPVCTARPSVSTARPVCTARPSVSTARPVGTLAEGNLEILLQDHAVVDSGCSSHMTGNKAYLSDYEDFNGGFVAFRSDPKGDEFKFNLFSISQMCDKKNSVLFTESECLILSPSFKLLDESQVVLRAPRKDDVYNLDLKNIVPSGGSSGKDKGLTQEYILLPLQPHRTRIPIEDVSLAAHEKPSESSPKYNDIQDSEDVIDKEGQHQMPEDEQVLHDELKKMVTQELTAKAMDDVSRQAFEEEKRRIASQKKAAQDTSTNKLSTDRQSVSTDRPFVSTDRSSVSTANTPYVSTARTSTGANAGESSFVYLGGKIPINSSTLPNLNDLPN